MNVILFTTNENNRDGRHKSRQNWSRLYAYMSMQAFGPPKRLLRSSVVHWASERGRQHHRQMKHHLDARDTLLNRRLCNQASCNSLRPSTVLAGGAIATAGGGMPITGGGAAAGGIRGTSGGDGGAV